MTTTEPKRTRTNFYEKAVEWIAKNSMLVAATAAIDLSAIQESGVVQLTAAVFNRDPFEVAVDVVRKSRSK